MVGRIWRHLRGLAAQGDGRAGRSIAPLVLGGAAVLVGAAACGGQPPVGHMAGGGDGPVGSVSVTRPCSLLTPGDLAQLGMPLARPTSDVAPNCRLTGPYITSHVTYFDDFSPQQLSLGPQISVKIGRYKALRNAGPVDEIFAPPPITAHDTACEVIIGLTSWSSVTVGADVSFQSSTDPCPVATRIAQLIEPQLPWPDPCLIGTWTPAREVISAQINSKPVLLTGPGGRQIFWADGTGEVDYGAHGTTYTATSGGSRWTEVIIGSAAFNWDTEDGMLLTSGVSANGYWTLRRNGAYSNSGTLDLNQSPSPYTCSAHAQREIFPGGAYVALTR